MEESCALVCAVLTARARHRKFLFAVLGRGLPVTYDVSACRARSVVGPANGDLLSVDLDDLYTIWLGRCCGYQNKVIIVLYRNQQIRSMIRLMI